MFYIATIVGLFIRVILIPSPGFKADMAYWKGWGLAVADKGIVWLINQTNYNYPPGFAYILYLVNKIYALFKNPYAIDDYWLDTNLLYLILIKSVTILGDIGIVVLLILFAKRLKSKMGYVLGAVYFLSPATFFDGAFWGQVDQIGLFFFLLSVYLLLLKRPLWGAAIFTLSCLLKFQNIIFIPLFFLFIYRYFSFRALVKSIQYAAVTFILITLPFFLENQLTSLFRLLIANADWFQYYSLNAFNVWWLFAKMQGMSLSDRELFLGITTAKQFSLILFIGAYFVSSMMIFRAKKDDLIKNFIIALCFAILSFFHLLTQSHERYAFHALGFMLILLMIDKKSFLKRNLILFAIFSIGFFVNLYQAMYFNYPDVVFWPWGDGAARYLSAVVSVIQVGSFLAFFFYFVWPAVRSHLNYIFVFWIILSFFLFKQNLPFILGQPIPLTKIPPIYQAQDYLKPVNNMTVDSGIDPMKWNRLSVNYFFYERGIGAHADSRLEYHLKGKFSRLTTDYAVDTEGHESTNVIFSIEGDGRELFRSKPKGRFDYPSSVVVPVRGVNTLVLKITKAGDTNFGAHADWLNPMLIR